MRLNVMLEPDDDYELAFIQMRKERDLLRDENETLRAENEALREIVEAVAHIGVYFGYGAFELSNEHIEKARALIESQATKGDE